MVPPSVRVIDMNGPGVLRVALPLRRYLKNERPIALLSALNHANLVAMASAAHITSARPRTIISIHNNLGKEMEVRKGIREQAIPWLLGHLHHWADGIVAVSH